MKFYAKFENGVSVQKFQLDEEIDPPQGSIEISEELFSKQLKLVGEDVIARSEAEMEAEAHKQQFDFLKSVLDDNVQRHMDSVVRQRGYTNVIYAVSYFNSTKAQFKAEAEAVAKFRDDVWEKCIEVLASVEAGNREIPTIEEMIAELPAIEWPAA